MELEKGKRYTVRDGCMWVVATYNGKDDKWGHCFHVRYHERSIVFIKPKALKSGVRELPADALTRYEAAVEKYLEMDKQLKEFKATIHDAADVSKHGLTTCSVDPCTNPAVYKIDGIWYCEQHADE